MQWRHHDGHLLDVFVHGAPLSLPDGTVVGWMGSALDITERKRIERRAARQQDMLEASGRLIAVGEVASTLAHELNQPLGALSSFANGLLNRLQQQSITLDEVGPVVERMARIAEKAGSRHPARQRLCQTSGDEPAAAGPFALREPRGGTGALARGPEPAPATAGGRPPY